MGRTTSLERIQEAYLYFLRSCTCSEAVIPKEMAEQDNLQFDYHYARWWYNSFFLVVGYNEDGDNSSIIFYDDQGTIIMADKSQDKTLAKKTSAVQWPKRSNKWP